MKRKKNLKTINDLWQARLVSGDQLPLLQEVVKKFDVSINENLVDLIDSQSKHDPIAAQFVPNIQELIESEYESSDPIGDANYEKVKGVVHRYPDRCLLKVVSVCPVYCRFCFRKEMIGPGKVSLSKQELATAFEYIEQHTDNWEVILTGGEPFILKPSQLANILTVLDKIPHVEVIRFHTRVPVVDPERITDDLIKKLKISKAVYVVLHTNHPNEFTPQAINACARLVDAGIPMLSQSVLLKGVNDNPETLKNLFKTFVKNRIKPYQLHHLDLAKGTNHFRVSIEKGQALMKALQGHISGLCQPTYMLEIPGGAGKMPISPCYLHKLEEAYEIEDYRGDKHNYVDITSPLVGEVDAQKRGG